MQCGRSFEFPHCTLPLTGIHCIQKVVTDLGVFDIKDGAFHLVERAADVSIEEIQAKTAGKLVIPEAVGIVQ